MQTIKDRLKNDYPYKIEMHAHTRPVSFCSDVTPEELIEIYADLGYQGIVITNHFVYNSQPRMTKEEFLAWYIKDYQDASVAGKAYGIKVYLGAELRFDKEENDYLLYGADADVLSLAYDYLGKGLAPYRNEVDLCNSVLLQAHPFRRGLTLAPPELLDGIETLNMHPGHNSEVGLAIRYAKEQKFPIVTAGSDFHHPNRGHEGLAALRCRELPEDSFALAKMLRNRDYCFELGGASIVLP
jgi:hypothetical protein